MMCCSVSGGISWCSLVFRVVFHGVLWCFGWYFMVFCGVSGGVSWCSVVFRVVYHGVSGGVS